MDNISDIENISTQSKINSWNSKIENAVKNIGEKCQSYKLMHLYIAQSSDMYYRRYMFAGIILSPVSGTISSIDAVSEKEGYNIILPIIAAIFSFVCGIIFAIIKFGKYDEVSSAHKTAAARYTSLENNVRRQLTLYRNDRIAAREYLEWLSISYDELFSASPLVSTSVYEKFIKKAEILGIFIPENYNDTIVIEDGYEDEKVKELVNNSEIVLNKEVNENEREYEETEEKIEIVLTPRDEEINNKTTEFMKDEKSYNRAQKIVKRTSSFSSIPDLSKYNDGMMKYEMSRLLGLRD